MQQGWGIVIDFTLLSFFLVVALSLKSKVEFLQKYMIPTSIIAGFMGLILGPEVLNIVPLDIDRLGNVIYHLMAIGFISLALKERQQKKSFEAFNTGAVIVSTYLVQGIVGFFISIALVYTIYPDLFPAMGLLLPLGYGQGPGQCYSIGAQWEALGFDQGGNIGLTIAAFGFLWSCIGGIPLMNYLIKKKKLVPVKPLEFQNGNSADKEDINVAQADTLDRLTIQLMIIGIIYLVTYLALKGIALALSPLGLFGQTLANLFFGFHFIIATLFAMLWKNILKYLSNKKIINKPVTDNYLLEKISGATFDYMVAASIAAISIATFKNYFIPIMLITTIGGIVSVIFIVYICKKVYKNYLLEYIVSLYGMLTGTISTGLALLKEVDANFDSPAAENLVLGSSTGLLFGFPLMMVLNIPIIGYVSNKPIMYALTFVALIVYLIILLLFIKLSLKKEEKRKKL